MSEKASVLALLSPAAFAVLTMLIADIAGEQGGVLAIALTGLAALVIGFFVTFTIAWSVTSEPVAVWSAALVVGVGIGMVGHLLTREKSHG